MPYALDPVNPPTAAALDQLAGVLRRLRDLAVDIPEQHGNWTPRAGSAAERDLAEQMFPEDVNAYLLHHPRSVCSLYVLAGTHYLAGIAALLEKREVLFAAGALARAAFEHGVRGLLVLDPRTNARRRSARAMLDDLVSARQQRLTFSHLVGREDPLFQGSDKLFAALRAVAERSFEGVSLADDSHRWHIESESYLRMNAAAKSWSNWRQAQSTSNPTPMQAEGLYDALCLYTHPQSFPSRHEAVYGPDVDVPHMQTNFETIAKLALGAHAAVWDAASVLYSYHGWDVPELAEIAEAASAVPLDA